MAFGKKQLLFLLGCIAACIVAAVLFLRLRTPAARNIKDLLKERPLTHLGIMMDGNRRWAKKHGFKPWIGHKNGIEPLKTTIAFCLENNIKHLTVYTLSLENLKRPQEELDYLFNILAKEIASKELEDLFKNGICVRFIGDRSQFPAQLAPIIEDVEQKTAANNKLYLNLLFCYGGQQEIIAAAQKLCAEKAPMTKESFTKALWSGELPPLDLIVRPTGDQRLSNFMIFQAAYSELYFTPVLWPDFTKKDLEDAVLFFVKSKRNFGA